MAGRPSKEIPDFNMRDVKESSENELDELRRQLTATQDDLKAERSLRLLISQKVTVADTKARGLLEVKLFSWEPYDYPALDSRANPITKNGVDVKRYVRIDFDAPTYHLQGVKRTPGETEKPLNGLVRALIRNNEAIYVMFRDRHALTNDLEVARALLRGHCYSLKEIYKENKPATSPIYI